MKRMTTKYGDPAVAQEWPTPLDESADEKNDAEIFRAVVESMRQWTLHKKLHHRTRREVSKVCYEDVGCFEDTGPFSYLEMLPSPPKDVGTRFLVYGSRKARSIPMEVPADDINDNAHRAIDPDLPTKVIVHGFGSSCDHVWVYEMRSALMTVHECNIVCVDWGPGSAVPNYVRAAANTRLVGRQLAKLVRSLNVPLEKVHLIGFSLGAHVAGFAGAELGNVSRITGLDPAGPLFESQDPRARLDKTDANFVDVIHSNGEQLLLGGLGSWQPMGDVDFYPNGGRMQTGCSNLFLGAVSDIIWSSAVEGRSLCNHRRAYKLFTDSVSPKCRFPAFPCDNGYDGLLRGECFPCGTNGNSRPCGDMGYYSNESPARGQLYLVTRDEEPFCAYQYQVKVYNSHSERPTRSYGKLQVTLVGDGSFNDTFAMTKKDEELVVGSVLQKIVVPHPAISDVEAIEIKYTAYSGWISSGLVSWSIDKLAIIDSFGKTLSVCKKGLSLESGKPVYLPLFSGECNVPSESDNSTSPTLERLVQEKQGGIGPFTKEQNYEQKDSYSIETLSKERTTASLSSSKGVGPFTKDQNIRIIEGKENSNNFEDLGNRRSNSPWNIIDISSDGDSNSLENSDSEKGRGFSSSNFFTKTSSPHPSVEPSTEFLPEIREPVLQVDKKETGRSLKFPEITEPILRPRSARQNTRNEMKQDQIQQETLSTSRAFTVQFLPERLAGILAQAERYARQTLLPLISQYTPSFVSGSRYEEPKYFPPLGEIATENYKGSVEQTTNTGQQNFSMKHNQDNQTNGNTETVFKEEMKTKSHSDITQVVPAVVEVIYPEKDVNSSTAMESNEWVPIEPFTLSSPSTSRKNLNVSRSLNWEHERYNWSTQTENSSLRSKVDDWVPITIKNEIQISESSNNVSNEISSTHVVTDKQIEFNQMEAATIKEFRNNSEAVTKDERKYIPLTDPEVKELSSTSSNDISETSSSSTSSHSTYSHIQKIPRPKNTRNSKVGNLTRRSMVFPYAYEKNKDPRTRYIPLIPEEDLKRPHFPMERKR
ncbi:Pancreatic lipase-related protein [Apis cerana cerana]|uniref:phospholipase A1 n=1 Tax=Apis cerana cerana TaxID=94128 RepID=A0A2A3EJV3_APICC|nr:Pancreatic lipase-related protein [Apis cerana cerana]